MPPRPRKTAAPSPSLEGAAVLSPQIDEGEPAAAVAEDPPTVPDPPPAATVPSDAAEPAPAPTAEDPAQPTKAEALANLGAQPPATYHWETPDAVPGDPCRVCNPAGPPPGAGSVGCGHGQWVRVPDSAG